MEHVLIRNAGLNQVEAVRLTDGAFTQSCIGRPPFKLDDEGVPVRVRAGDRVYVAQSGRGVVGTVVVSSVEKAIVIPDHKFIGGLKRQYPMLEATYWEHLRESLDRSAEKGKLLWFQAIWTKLEKRYKTSEQFPLHRAIGAQSSWVYLESDSIRAELFKFRGQGISEVFRSVSDAKYGEITEPTRWAVTQIWKGEWFGDRRDGETLHFDHLVPKAVGGPGIFPENVVPLPKSLNLTKKHGVIRALPEVAIRRGLVAEKCLQLWKEVFLVDSPDKKRIFNERLKVGRTITSAVREMPIEEQRRFYFEVLVQAVGERARRMFQSQGMYST